MTLNNEVRKPQPGGPTPGFHWVAQVCVMVDLAAPLQGQRLGRGAN